MFIQNCSFSKSKLLDETLIDCFQNAVSAVGVYAFVSIGGISLYLENDNFTNFIKNNQFTLIIGIDEITNTRAVNKLIELQDRYINLRIKAFYERSNYIFHPKFSWFKYPDNTGKLVLGSGNLTLRGLRQNVEAFTIQELNPEEMNNLEEYWNTWIDESEDSLKDLTDQIVIDKVKDNQTRYNYTRRVETIAEIDIETETIEEIVQAIREDNIEHDHDIDDNIWSFNANNRSLIVDLPKERWGQASFKKPIIIKFFNQFIGTGNADNYNIVLKYVSAEKISEEIRILKYKPGSGNYYMELGEIKKLKNKDIPPLVIFIEVAQRTYLYSLFQPNDTGYDLVNAYLQENNQAKPTEKRWTVSTCNDIEGIISTLPINKYAQ